jgi:DNA-binding response OmpR family regulator
MPRHRVLIVEDELDLAGLIKHALERNGDADAEIAATGEAALKAVAARLPDLIILDLNLPILGGLEVCRILRGRSDAKHLPIIMLTARGGEDDRVSGLEQGADDYVTKPFSLRELTARVRAVLRRSTATGERTVGAYNGAHLVADFDAVAVTVDGEAIRLTRREFELLRYLVQNKSRVVSRDRLLERVWGYDRLVETRSVDVHVGRLRSKLGIAGQQIETVVGLGYRFIDAPT